MTTEAVELLRAIKFWLVVLTCVQGGGMVGAFLLALAKEFLEAKRGREWRELMNGRTAPITQHPLVEERGPVIRDL